MDTYMCWIFYLYLLFYFAVLNAWAHNIQSNIQELLQSAILFLFFKGTGVHVPSAMVKMRVTLSSWLPWEKKRQVKNVDLKDLR